MTAPRSLRRSNALVVNWFFIAHANVKETTGRLDMHMSVRKSEKGGAVSSLVSIIISPLEINNYLAGGDSQGLSILEASFLQAYLQYDLAITSRPQIESKAGPGLAIKVDYRLSSSPVISTIPLDPIIQIIANGRWAYEGQVQREMNSVLDDVKNGALFTIAVLHDGHWAFLVKGASVMVLSNVHAKARSRVDSPSSC